MMTSERVTANIYTDRYRQLSCAVPRAQKKRPYRESKVKSM